MQHVLYAVFPISHPPRTLPTSDPHTFLRSLRKLLFSSSRTDVVRTDEPHNPYDVCFFYLFASQLT
ncbi:hypothetical protein BDR04DRAFT_1099177 [Suillus decipiens]|nr:hypothetical protein BDR04DRAFT_1099177 [Suillus decipiens]